MSAHPRDKRRGRKGASPTERQVQSDGSGSLWHGRLHRPCLSGWLDPLIGLLLAVLYTVLLLSTIDDLGYARDEGFYFQAARAYGRWFELLWRDSALALEQVDRTWRINSEHPALIKSLFALSHLIGFERYRLFAMEGTSFRFPAMVLSGLGVGLTYLWGTRAHGRLTGLTAAASLAALPRFFFHAHLACFDAPVTTMWMACAYAYWRALQRGGLGWPLGAGVLFGLALNTKHNSWFLPIVCTAHALCLLWPGLSAGLTRRTVIKRALGALGCMAVIGPLVFYALWPWIWHDTWARLEAYASFHLHHVYYNMEFLGQNYFQPPMPQSYAFVMTAATVPAVTLLLFAIGVLLSSRGAVRRLWAALGRLTGAAGQAGQGAADRRPAAAGRAGDSDKGEAAAGAAKPLCDPATALLWGLAMAVQYGAWLSPDTPIFGGTKHWLTAYPFLALFAGYGLSQGVCAWRRAWADKPSALLRGPWLELTFLASALGAPAAEALGAHPFGLSSYSPLVGGAAGGATLGLNRGFWGYTTGAVADHLNATAPRGARIYYHDTAAPSWDMLQRDGRLRRDIRGVSSIAGADLGLYHHEKHMAGQEYQAWVAFETAVPDHIAGLDGVPVIWVYRRPGLSHGPVPTK